MAHAWLELKVHHWLMIFHISVIFFAYCALAYCCSHIVCGWRIVLHVLWLTYFLSLVYRCSHIVCDLRNISNSRIVYNWCILCRLRIVVCVSFIAYFSSFAYCLSHTVLRSMSFAYRLCFACCLSPAHSWLHKSIFCWRQCDDKLVANTFLFYPILFIFFSFFLLIVLRFFIPIYSPFVVSKFRKFV